MEIAIREANNYWGMLKGLSNEVKLELIARLSNSMIKREAKANAVSASDFYGIWKDSPKSGDEIWEELKEERRFKNEYQSL